ncbi:hypothetical protein BHM03_00021383 [Ensete ventricosum]|nr:hypothetical protein BHM03_00021383 [Ensete ventricosum]
MHYCKRPLSASIPPIGTKHCSSPSAHTSNKEKPRIDYTVTLNRDGDLTCDAHSLKALNQILLDEMMVRRKQVNDLHARLVRLSFASGLERSVTHLVISSRLAGFAAEMAAAKEKEKENDLLISRLKLEATTGDDNSTKQALNEVILERNSALLKLEETAFQVETAVSTGRAVIAKLQSDLEERKAEILVLEADKASMVERNGSTEKAPRSSNDQLQLIEGHKGGIEKDLERAVLESDACKRDLDAMPTALEKTDGSQASIDAFDEKMVKMQHGFEDKSKGFILRSDQCKMEELREERGILETEIANLQGRVSVLQATGQETKALEEKLRLAEETLMKSSDCSGFVTGEKDYLKKALDPAILERASNQRRNATVTEEADMSPMEIDSSGNENKGLQVDNEGQIGDRAREVDRTVNSLKKIIEEEDAIDRSRAMHEDEIPEMQRAMADLLSCLSALQDFFRTNTESNARLQTQNAPRDLDLEKAEVSGPREKMKKDDVHGKLQEMKALPESLMTENKDFNKDFDSPTLRRASREAKEGRSRSAASGKYERAFNLINFTRDLSFTIKECEDNAFRIKTDFNRNMALIQDMLQELKLLRDAIMVEARNNGGIRTWLYPAATTFLAAIYLAYAAKR